MKIATDKKLHFLVSAVIALIVGAIMAMALYKLEPERPALRSVIACATAFLVTLSIGVYKELLDRKQPGNHFCRRDLCADFVGAMVGSSMGLVSYLL